MMGRGKCYPKRPMTALADRCHRSGHHCLQSSISVTKGSTVVWRRLETPSLSCSILASFLCAGCGFAFLVSPNAAAEQMPQQTSDLAHQFESARAHYAAHQYARAEKELEDLRVSLPDSFELNELLGLVHSAQGQDEKADPFFKKAVHLRPNSSKAHALLAANLARSRKDSEAEEEFHGTVELAPEDFDANCSFGEFYLHKGRLRGAIPYLEKGQKVNRFSYENGYNLALAYLQIQNYSGARRQIGALLQMGETPELHSLLGDAEEKTGDPARATNEFVRAAQMDPSEDNLINLGVEFARHQGLDPALKVFKEGAGLYAHSARMQVGLGSCHYLRKEYDRAFTAFSHATELDPSNPNVYLVLAKVYTSSAPLGGEGVAKRLRILVQLKPNDPLAYYYYALSLRKEARDFGRPVDPAKVEPVLKTAVRLDPRMAGAYLQLGILYFEAHRYTEASQMYQRAIMLQPEASEAHCRLGQALARTGQKEDAREESELYRRLLKREELERGKRDTEILQLIYPREANPKVGPSEVVTK